MTSDKGIFGAPVLFLFSIFFFYTISPAEILAVCILTLFTDQPLTNKQQELSINVNGEEDPEKGNTAP